MDSQEGHFVLLRHECPADAPRDSHWDFMLLLPSASRLATWALNDLPREWMGSLAPVEQARHAGEGRPDRYRAVRLSDHRLDYIEYEGPLSEGRGTVSRMDHGRVTYQAISEDRIAARLHGIRIQSGVTLVHATASPDIWWLSVSLQRSSQG